MIVLSRPKPRLSRRYAHSRSDRHFAAENFYTISTDTHIDDLVILRTTTLRRAHKNAARTVHFEPLLNQHLLLARRNTVRNHPRGATTGGRTRRRIISVVKNHAGVQTSLVIDR